MHTDIRQALEKFPEHVNKATSLAEHVVIDGDIENIIISGMGGSGIAGDLIKDYLDIKIPICVCKDYSIPEFVNSKTLVFILSYSGDTEEVISSYRNALRKGCKIVCLASAGKLLGLAEKQGKISIKLPYGLQPRFALPYLFFPILKVLENSKIIRNQEVYFGDVIKSLTKSGYEQKGKELAKRFVDKIPLIYTSTQFKSVGYRWKCQINENAKVHAFCNVFSEINHNEMMGFTSLKGYYYVVIIRDELDSPQLRKRMALTKEIIRESGVDVIELGIKGGCLLTKLFSAVYIGDWTSYYLALAYGKDPNSVSLIEDFKEKL